MNTVFAAHTSQQCFCGLLGFCRTPCCSADSIGSFNPKLSTFLPQTSPRDLRTTVRFISRQERFWLTVSLFQWNLIHHGEEGLDHFMAADICDRGFSHSGQPGSRSRYNIHRQAPVTYLCQRGPTSQSFPVLPKQHHLLRAKKNYVPLGTVHTETLTLAVGWGSMHLPYHLVVLKET